MTVFGLYPNTQDSSPVIKVGVTVCGVQHILRVLGVRVANDPKPVFFPYNENSTRALNITSLKCCLASTDAIDGLEKNLRMRMKVEDRLMQARFIEFHEVFEKKKIGYFIILGILHYCVGYYIDIHVRVRTLICESIRGCIGVTYTWKKYRKSYLSGLRYHLHRCLRKIWDRSDRTQKSATSLAP